MEKLEFYNIFFIFLPFFLTLVNLYDNVIFAFSPQPPRQTCKTSKIKKCLMDEMSKVNQKWTECLTTEKGQNA